MNSIQKQLLFSFLFWIGTHAFAQSLSLKNPIRYLALGDSYTIGHSVAPAERWPNQLSDSLILRSYQVDTTHIIATTGWTTRNLLNAISGKNLENQQFSLVSLLIGVNNQYQGLDIEWYPIEFKALLDSCIRYAGGDTSCVFVVSIPDYAYTPFGNGSAAISQGIDLYNQINDSITATYGITYFNITPISRQGLADPSLVARDGLHPSGSQYTEWVKLILEYLDATQSTATSPLVPLEVLKIYPVPAQGTIRVAGLPTQSADFLRIIDLQGRQVKQVPIDSSGTTEIIIDSLAQGMYKIEALKGGRIVGIGGVIVE